MRLGVSAESGEQWVVGGALANLLEVTGFESGTTQQLVPALFLSDAGESLVLGG